MKEVLSLVLKQTERSSGSIPSIKRSKLKQAKIKQKEKS